MASGSKGVLMRKGTSLVFATRTALEDLTPFVVRRGRLVSFEAAKKDSSMYVLTRAAGVVGWNVKRFRRWIDSAMRSGSSGFSGLNRFEMFSISMSYNTLEVNTLRCEMEVRGLRMSVAFWST